jgi:hypothetical protein
MYDLARARKYRKPFDMIRDTGGRPCLLPNATQKDARSFLNILPFTLAMQSYTKCQYFDYVD